MTIPLLYIIIKLTLGVQQYIFNKAKLIIPITQDRIAGRVIERNEVAPTKLTTEYVYENFDNILIT